MILIFYNNLLFMPIRSCGCDGSFLIPHLGASATFALMLRENTLTQHLIDIDHQANEQIDIITSRLARAEGVTEELKARDQLEWIRQMNSCRARAEEQVIREIVLV